MALILGTNFSETLLGTPDADDIFGRAGSDILRGGSEMTVFTATIPFFGTQSARRRATAMTSSVAMKAMTR